MHSTTPAIIFKSPGQVIVDSISMPPPGPGEVQIRTKYSGVSSGTEGWCLADSFTWAKTPFPCVPGYQRVGQVTAVGSDVSTIAIGATVLATFGSWAGKVQPFWGAHVALANSPVSEIYCLPTGIDEISVANAIVAQVGFNAASRITLTPGDWVVVYGDGIIGQMAAQAVRARGGRAIVVGHRSSRLHLARAHSSNAAIDNRRENVAAKISEITGNKTVAAVIDTVQSIASEAEYVPLLEHGKGQVVYSGFTPGQCWSDMGLVQRQELTCHHVSGWTRPRLEETLSFISRRQMQVGPLTSHLVPFSNAPAIWSMISTKSSDFLGITIDWEGALR